MSNHRPILIVGAGPAGLMMACELARRGISFRIIDKNSERTPSSNATWIQTRTIEIFNHMGIVDRFLKIGHECNGISLYNSGKILATIPLNNIESTFPFVLMLSQSEIERLLTEYLKEFNVEIERSSELVDLQESSNSVTATIKNANGIKEDITTDWLIACDGSNSTIREKCHIFFPGEDINEQFIVADAKIKSFMSKDNIHIYFDEGSIFSAAPLGGDSYRITANLHLDYPRKIFTEIGVIELAQERAHGAYYVTEASWISSFWIHSKLTNNMRKNSIFLVGDAAHIHSPIGGQGMNTGLQDAYNLAWKLALVINQKANPSLLDSYQLERYPVVSKIVNQTEILTKMFLFDKEFLSKLKKFSKKIMKNESTFSAKVGNQITQLDIKYPESPIISYDEHATKGSPQQGERAPDVVIDPSKKLYDYLKNTSHNILLFIGSATTKDNVEKIKKFRNYLYELYADNIKIHIITKEELPGFDNIILDKNNTIHERYYAEKPTVYLIRPDGYIACYSKNIDPAKIKNILSRYLH
ncbi:MAG: FAD-dependent monooxygenase [Gammaproteobacteria bacterium]